MIPKKLMTSLGSPSKAPLTPAPHRHRHGRGPGAVLGPEENRGHLREAVQDEQSESEDGGGGRSLFRF